MIHEIGVELQAALRAQGCPFSVVDGPEQTQTTTYGRERIVIAHDDGGDSFSSPKGHAINPRLYGIRNIGVKITIYAQRVGVGATEFEHRRRAEQVIDMVIVALTDIAATRKNGFAIKGGKFVEPADLEKSTAAAGSVYELQLTWERGIAKRKWDGSKRPEAAVGDGMITSATKVSLRGGVDDDDDPTTVPASAETACGD